MTTHHPRSVRGATVTKASRSSAGSLSSTWCARGRLSISQGTAYQVHSRAPDTQSDPSASSATHLVRVVAGQQRRDAACGSRLKYTGRILARSGLSGPCASEDSRRPLITALHDSLSTYLPCNCKPSARQFKHFDQYSAHPPCSDTRSGMPTSAAAGGSASGTKSI